MYIVSWPTCFAQNENPRTTYVENAEPIEITKDFVAISGYNENGRLHHIYLLRFKVASTIDGLNLKFSP